MSGFEGARILLEQTRDELLARRVRIEARQREKLEPDFAEQATQRENEDVVQALDVASRDRLVRIRRALARLDAGEYGNCENCGKEIAAKRLEAIPYAELCIDCAEREESAR